MDERFPLSGYQCLKILESEPDSKFLRLNGGTWTRHINKRWWHVASVGLCRFRRLDTTKEDAE